MLNLIVLILMLALSQRPAVEKRGYTIWIGPCGYSYYMPETDDGLPEMFGNARTVEEAQAIVNGQDARDDKLRKQLRKIRQ